MFDNDGRRHICQTHMADTLMPPIKMGPLGSNGIGAFLWYNGFSVAIDEVGYGVTFGGCVREVSPVSYVGLCPLSPSSSISETAEARRLRRIPFQVNLDVVDGISTRVCSFTDGCHRAMSFFACAHIVPF